MASRLTARTHGHTVGPRSASTRSPTYNVWRGMIGRCTQPSDGSYPAYGGSGVTVDKTWLTFGAFLTDMGERPDGMTLDRVDNAKGYSPDNCRWATRTEQARNRRSNRFLDYDGQQFTMAEWAERIGKPARLISLRLSRGWTVERALSA